MTETTRLLRAIASAIMDGISPERCPTCMELSRAYLKVPIDKLSDTEYPQQPIVVVDGVERFEANPLVRRLLDAATVGNRCDLNMLAMDPVDKKYHRQLAQLIGYSLGGYDELSYTHDE